jgi:hypothetical protein
MMTVTAPTLTALDALACANLFLIENLPDRITAGQPRFDDIAYVWRVPVILTYPTLGALGVVGEIVISATDKTILSATPPLSMRATALALANQHRDAIEAAIP